MAAPLKWDEGSVRRMRGRLEKLARSYPTATEGAAANIGTAVLYDAINETPTVPIRTGNLRSSGTFEVIPRGLARQGVRLTVGFNTPYAARVHQVPMNFTEPGAGNYFLSAKLDRHRREYVEAWARDVSRRVGTG